MRSLRASFRSPRPHTHDSRKTPLRRRERLFGSGDDPASGRSAMQTQTDLNILSCREGPGRLLVPSGSATRIGGAWGAQGGLVPRRRPTPPCGQGSGRDKVGGRPAFPNSTQGMLAMFSGLNLSSSFIFSIVFLNKLSATRAVAGSARECGRSRPADADRSRRSHRCESRRRRRMRAAGGPRDDRTERIPLVESSPQRAGTGGATGTPPPLAGFHCPALRRTVLAARQGCRCPASLHSPRSALRDTAQAQARLNSPCPGGPVAPGQASRNSPNHVSPRPEPCFTRRHAPGAMV